VSYPDGTTASYSYTSIPIPNGNSVWNVLTTAADVRADDIPSIRYEIAAFSEKNVPGFVKAVRNNAEQSLVVQGNSNANGPFTPTNATLSYPDGRVYNYTTQSTNGLITTTYTATNSSGSTTYNYNLSSAQPTIKTTDAKGNLWTETTDKRGKLLSRAAPDGAVATWSYDAGGYPISATDENGNTTTYTRDPSREWITSITYPDSAQECFTYNDFGEVLTHTQRNGGVASYNYSADGLLLSKSSATGEVMNYTYDGQYRVASVTDGRNNTTSFLYNDRWQTTRTTNPDGSYTTYEYDGVGNLTRQTNELGCVATYTYDSLNRRLTMSDPLGRTTLCSYAVDTPGNSKPTLMELPSGKKVATTYNTTFQYKVASKTVGFGSPDASTTAYIYDIVGNLVSTTDPRGKTTSFGYDNRNRQIRVTDTLNNTTTTTYDAVGNKLAVTRPGNYPMQYEYDAMNRLKKQIDERGFASYMSYDSTGNMSSQTDENGNVYSYGYDAMDRKTRMGYPDFSYEEFSYDAASNVATHRNRAGNRQYFSYDNRNRQVWFNWDDGVTQPQLTIYDAASRATSIQNWEADITPTYDCANQKTSETETIKSYGMYATRSTVYQYDPDGNRSRVAYPQGYQFLYVYTNRNQLDNLKLDPAIFGGYYNIPLVQYAYDASGNRTTRTVLSGAHADYDIDGLNRISGQTTYFANVPSGRFDYGFDAMGRRRYEQRDWWTADGYVYDPSDELTGYKRDGSLNSDGTVSAAFWNNTALSYDGTGNRVQVTGNGANSYSVNSLNQYTSDANGAMGYDPKGNLSSCDGWTYGYDAQNRMITADNYNSNVHIFNTYDGMNRIITRNVNGAVTQNVWDDWNLIEEHRPDWSIQRCYLYGATQNDGRGF
jgi:YD repeat-containing protein